MSWLHTTQQSHVSSCMWGPWKAGCLDCALVQRLGKQDYPVFQGKPGSGCGHYICHIPGTCDMLRPPFLDSGYHRQISQPNPEITPASPPLQLNALVWLKECMLYKETGGEARSHVGLRNRTSGLRKGTETKRKELRKKEWLLVFWAKKERATEGFRSDRFTCDFSGSS